MQQNLTQPTVQRAIMNRHQQARRSNSSIAPKLEPGAPLQNQPSPQSRPTPSSHASSPTSNSPGFANQGVMTPPASDSLVQQQQLHQQQLHHQHQQQQHRLQPAKSQGPHGLPGAAGLVNAGMIGGAMGPKGQGSRGTGSTGSTPVAAAYYPSPFQNHIEQLGKLSHPLLSLYFFSWNYVRPRLIP